MAMISRDKGRSPGSFCARVAYALLTLWPIAAAAGATPADTSSGRSPSHVQWPDWLPGTSASSENAPSELQPAQAVAERDEPESLVSSASVDDLMAPVDQSIWDPNSTSLFDGLSVFGGLDGSKQPQDLGVNANMGGRVAFNWGIPVYDEWGLGIQVGLGYNFSADAVQVLNRIGANNGRTQLYNTVGVFQRTDWGFNWSFGHDYLWEKYYDDFALGQWRGRAGYQITPNDEIGAWGTIRDFGDSGYAAGTKVNLQPIQQASAFWQHLWPSGAWTSLWVGGAVEHGRFVLVLPDYPAIKPAFVYGAALQMPLNNYLAIYGEANFITPASSGTVDAFLGFSYYPGGGVCNPLRKRYAPLMGTASNTTFAVDIPR